MTERQQEPQRAAIALPEFENPPINELVCGAQFESIGKWQTPHFGLFWERVKEEYPEFEDQNPLVTLGDPTGRDSVKLRAENGSGAMSKLPMRRVWLIDRSRQYLMQVDPPRFLHNWRRLKETDPYPRFQTAYAKFMQSLDQFTRFVRESSLGEPRFDLYELSYINHIVGGEGSAPSDLYKHLSCYQCDPESRFVGKPEGLQMSFRFPLAGKRGILVVDAKSGKRKSDNRDVLILDLTARGSAESGGKDMQEWYDLAHETIVRGFVELTTPEAHKVWRRTA